MDIPAPPWGTAFSRPEENPPRRSSPAARVVPADGVAHARAPFAQTDDYQQLLVAAHAHLLNAIEDEWIDIDAWAPDTVGRYVRTKTAAFVQAWRIPVDDAGMEIVAAALVKELIGFGPLDDLLHDPAIDDILINGHNDIHVCQGGRRVRASARFSDDNHLLRILRRILAPLGRRLDASHPMVEARLPNGGRLNAILPPLAVDGPMVSIRKLRKAHFTPDELVCMGTFDAASSILLQAMVVGRCNVLVCGSIRSGKTALLNALAGWVPPGERVVTVEDTPELAFGHPHVVRLERRFGGADGHGAVSVRELVRNSLRMRPDRILVGDVRGAEVLDLLHAMNTGHEGVMATLHADSPRDCLSRVEMLAGTAGLQGSDDSLRRQVASAIDVILQVSRLDSGRRVLVSITEVTGVCDGVICTQELVRHETQYDSDGRERDRWIGLEVLPRSHKLARFRRQRREALDGGG